MHCIENQRQEVTTKGLITFYHSPRRVYDRCYIVSTPDSNLDTASVWTNTTDELVDAYLIVQGGIDDDRLHSDVHLRDTARDQLGLEHGAQLLEDDTDEGIAD